MRYSQATYDRYPYCCNYIVNWLNPTVLKTKSLRVWNAFVEVIGDEVLAKIACDFHTGPWVMVDGKVVGRANGKYKGGEIIYIHTKVAEDYEYGTGWLNLEATLLHESCHWARYFLGKYTAKTGDLYNGEEAGKAFEFKAYGCDVTRGTTRCTD